MTPGRRRAMRALLGMLVLATLVGGFVAALEKDTSELPVYVTGALRMLDGAEIYRPDDPKPFTYPPFFALPFVPFTSLGEGAQRGAWFLLNVVLLVGSLALLRSTLRAVAPIAPGPWFVALVAVLTVRHLLAVFENQSHDLIVLLLLCAAARVGEIGAGAWSGLAGACKATPLLFLPTFAGQRRARAALAGVLVAVGATLLPDLVLPRTDGRLWVVAWIDTFAGAMGTGRPAAVGNAWSASNFLNQNLAGTLHRLFVVPSEASTFVMDVALIELGDGLRRAVTLAAQLAVAALVAFAAWPSRARGLDAKALGWRRFGEIGLVASAMLLLSPMSSKSHFCLLLLPATYCVGEGLAHRRRGIAMLLTLSFVLATLTTKGLVGRELGNTLLAYGVVTWGTLAMLLGSVVALTARPYLRS